MPRKPRFNHPIRELRRLMRLTQNQFAARIGISASMVQAMENGERPVSEHIARKISYATGVHPESITKRRSRPRFSFGPEIEETREKPEELWHSQVRIVNETASIKLEELEYPLEILFAAAVRAGGAKPFALGNSFLMWLQKQVIEFDLSLYLEAVLKERGSDPKTNSFLIGKQAENPALFWLKHRRPAELPEFSLEGLGISYGQFNEFYRDIESLLADNYKKPKVREQVAKAVGVRLLLHFLEPSSHFVQEYRMACKLLEKEKRR